MFYIGIDLGGTKIAAGIVDENGRLYSKEQISTQREKSGETVIESMSELARRAVSSANLSLSQIETVGIGIPATISADRKIIYNCNYVALDGLDIVASFQKHLKLPVYVDNDGNAAAWAEHIAGSAKGVDNSITITLGTGVGGGIVANNSIFRGFNGTAGEVGHMVIKTMGRRCVCDRRGCWEEYASATALIRQAKKEMTKHPESLLSKLAQFDKKRMDAKIPFQAAKLNDKISMNIIQQYIANVSAGIANLVVIFQPKYVCIGGGISNEGESLIGPIRDLVWNEAYPNGEVPKTQIVHARFANDAGIIGAALLCLIPNSAQE